jgi:hypothetical protein
MKKFDRFRKGLLFTSYYLVKLADSILHPLKDMPALDFNDQYDHNIL